MDNKLFREARERARRARENALKRMYGGSSDDADNDKSLEDRRREAVRAAVQRAREAALQFGGQTQRGRRNEKRDRSRSAEKRRDDEKRDRSRSAERRRDDDKRDRSRSVDRNANERHEAIRQAIARARSAALDRAMASRSEQAGGDCGLNRDLEGGRKLRDAMDELREALHGGKPKKGKKATKKVAKKTTKKVAKKTTKKVAKKTTKKTTKKAPKKVTKKLAKARKVRKSLKTKRQMKSKSRGVQKPSERTYVAFYGKPGTAPKMLVSPIGDKAKIYFHGLPGAAAKKVLTALTRKRKVSRGQYRSIAAKNAFNGPSHAVRITLVEVTKGMNRSAPKETGHLSVGAVKARHYQYHYFGWNVPVNVKPLTLSHKDKKTGKTVKNTFKPTCKHVVVRATKKANTVASAVAKAKVKANRSRKALAKGRKMRK